MGRSGGEEVCKLEFYRNVSGKGGAVEISVVNQGSPLAWIYRLVAPNLVRNRGRQNLQNRFSLICLYTHRHKIVALLYSGFPSDLLES